MVVSWQQKTFDHLTTEFCLSNLIFLIFLEIVMFTFKTIFYLFSSPVIWREFITGICCGWCMTWMSDWGLPWQWVLQWWNASAVTSDARSATERCVSVSAIEQSSKWSWWYAYTIFQRQLQVRDIEKSVMQSKVLCVPGYSEFSLEVLFLWDSHWPVESDANSCIVSVLEFWKVN